MRSSPETIRDGIEGTDQIGSLERGIAEEGNLQAALDTLLATAKDGDAAACEAGLQMCGDLWLYWHIRGKNLTAREYAASFLDADTGGSPTVGRAGALITAGLASDMLGQFERANDEWAEAYRIAAELRSRSRALHRCVLSGLRAARIRSRSRAQVDEREHREEPRPRLHLGRGVCLELRRHPPRRRGRPRHGADEVLPGARDPAADRRRGRSRPVARRPRRAGIRSR